MFLTEEQKKLVIEALEKKINGIDWVVKNKDLDEGKQDFLQNKAMKMAEIIDMIKVKE